MLAMPLNLAINLLQIKSVYFFEQHRLLTFFNYFCIIIWNYHKFMQIALNHYNYSLRVQ